MSAGVSELRRTYEDEYRSGRYSKLYAKETLPQHVIPMARYLCQVLTAVLDLRSGARVLELGCGTGLNLLVWSELGMDARGIEITQLAIDQKVTDCIIDHGDAVRDLDQYEDDQFDLVFSNQFLEHIPDEQILAVLAHQKRIAKYGAHLIAHVKGNDPTHVNVKKEPREWIDVFSKEYDIALCLANPLIICAPYYVQIRSVADTPEATFEAARHLFFPWHWGKGTEDFVAE